MDSMRRNAQKMMPHIMAMNKDPNVGMKNNRQPKPGVSNLTAYAKGGKVMAKGGAADKKQDKSMLSRHNRLMHPGQKSKLMNGGMVGKYADGGKTNPLALKFEKERDEPVKSLKGEEPKKALKEKSVDMSKRVDQGKMPKMPKMMNGGMMKGYGMGGKPMFKKGGKAKGDKKKVMGTVGEAKSIMAALKKARRPATPMPGTPMAGLGMAPPMKHGGKVRKYADGSKAEAKGFLDKPRDFITDDRYPNKKLSIRDVGKGVKEGFTNYKDMINRTGKFESPSKDGKVMKKAAGGAAKLRKKSPMPNKIKMMLYGKGG